MVRVVICSKLEAGPELQEKNNFLKPEVNRMDSQHLEKNYPSSWGFFVLNFPWFVVLPDSKHKYKILRVEENRVEQQIFR